jgi:hypothetical protein
VTYSENSAEDAVHICTTAVIGQTLYSTGQREYIQVGAGNG